MRPEIKALLSKDCSHIKKSRKPIVKAKGKFTDYLTTVDSTNNTVIEVK